MLSMLQSLAQQQYARLTGTWVNIVKTALIHVGGQAHLSDLYAHIEKSAPERLSANQHWREKVRQTLQRNEQVFKSVERGIWAVA